MNFYRRRAAKSGDFEAGIRSPLQAILASPQFLFRLESDAAARRPRQARTASSDHDLASRLSFFLWGSGPGRRADEGGAAGDAARRGALEKQVRRMLADPRVGGAVDALRRPVAPAAGPREDPSRLSAYPQYDDTLAHAMQRETELFFDSIVREDRSVLDLLTADYTFVNERLAQALRHPERRPATSSGA